MLTSNKKEQTSGTVYATGDLDIYNEKGPSEKSLATDLNPIQALKYESIIDIAASSLHCLAIDKKGEIWSWGCNTFGALGRDGEPHCPRPINHPSIKYVKFKKVACGGSISLALSSKNQLYAWGTFNSKEDIYGFLPNIRTQNYPRIINEVAKIHFIDISAGTSHCLALDYQGHVYSWGCAENNQLGRPINGSWETDDQTLIPVKLRLQDIIAIKCGAFHSIALNPFGQIYTWGLNHYHQCGLVDIDDNSEQSKALAEVIEVPTLIPYSKKISPFKVTKRKSISEDPKQWTHDTTTATKRKADDLIENQEMHKKNKDLQAGKAHGQKKKSEPTMDRTGNIDGSTNSQSHSGSNNSVGGSEPVKFCIEKSERPRAIDVAAGDYYSVVIMDDNSLVTWGQCDNGQLGIGNIGHDIPGALTSENGSSIHAIGYPYVNPWRCDEAIKAVICCTNHTMIVSKSGKVWGYGISDSYQLGTEEKDCIHSPTLIESVNNKGKILSAAGGSKFSLFLIQDNEN